jgi:hypothetical protein
LGYFSSLVISQESEKIEKLEKIVTLLQSQVNSIRKFEGISKIGEIRYSILTPSDFNKKYGNGWVLMNGQCISKSCCDVAVAENAESSLCPSDSPVKVKDSELWKHISSGELAAYDDKINGGKLPDARGKFLRSGNNELSGDTSDPQINRKIGNYQEGQTGEHVHRTQIWKSLGTFSDVGMAYREGLLMSLLPPHWTNNLSFDTTSCIDCDETRPKNIMVNVFIKIN